MHSTDSLSAHNDGTRRPKTNDVEHEKSAKQQNERHTSRFVISANEFVLGNKRSYATQNQLLSSRQSGDGADNTAEECLLFFRIRIGKLSLERT